MRHVDVLGDSSVSYPCSLQLADTRETPDDARCCSVLQCPIIYWSYSGRARHSIGHFDTGARPVILPAFSDGNPEILLIPL
jgi:hypothetical protein